jgi:hypothetical protein
VWWRVTSVPNWSHVLSAHCWIVCEAFSASKAHVSPEQPNIHALNAEIHSLKEITILMTRLQLAYLLQRVLAAKHDKPLEQQCFLSRKHQRPANSAHDILNKCSFCNIMLEEGRLTSARSVAHTLLPIANGCKAISILTYCVQAFLPKQLKSWNNQTPTHYWVSGIEAAIWSR